MWDAIQEELQAWTLARGLDTIVGGLDTQSIPLLH